MKLTQPDDKWLSRVVIFMIISFLCIQYTDSAGKFVWPLLLSALLSVMFLSNEFIPCLLILLAWFYLWTLVLFPRDRNRFRVGFSIGWLWAASAYPGWLYLHRADPSRQPWTGYLVTASLFILSSCLYLYWFYFTKKKSDSELDTVSP
ncbi:hypothetical protein GO755_14240 [Spirosoma sp. HMF4905]|uniref:Uncharacterized protein n=1 Tax=Spirosoma arboris TaxID=2682092 RepID=A0A7K1SBZ5_9BACT|nr:hypothetical protein [Spirosoma arboris]MVM31198.1 hypothetical protein [Spirosoma arboris]